MESYKIKNYKTGEITEVVEDKATTFLYGNVFGRILVKILCLRFISTLAGFYLDSKFSKSMIPKFVLKNKIDMSQYEAAQYKSFNEFFIRKIKPEKRPLDLAANILISPCDAKLSVYQINENSAFKIKDSLYQIQDLIGDDILASEYLNGYALIFRLAVDDYHRYCYIDNGFQKEVNYLGKELHTVRPIVLKNTNIYKRNFRVWSVLETENFDHVIQVEVGAMMVGKIVNHKAFCKVQKGEEKGYFKFGGSTIVLLFKQNIVNIDPIIINNTNQNIETIVKYGESIGQKKLG